MLPQDKGGVVDPKLKVRSLSLLPHRMPPLIQPPVYQVYGTQNIRVVDLSIVPLQITSHTQGPSRPTPSPFVVLTYFDIC